MKALLSCLLVACVPLSGWAQAPAAPAKPAAKASTKAGGLAPSARKAVEEATPIDDDPSIHLTETHLEVAKQVHMGDMKCELGASVKVTPARRHGMFHVMTKGHRFLMHPVDSRTGAIRLEDPRRGAMWLQLGNKSMLMSQKHGQRLADECQSPQQVTFAEELKKNPRPSILEPLPVPTAAASAPDVVAQPAAPAPQAPAAVLPASAPVAAPVAAPQAAPAAAPASAAQ